jgi:GMP synthase (glutamine-hydrolysing)
MSLGNVPASDRILIIDFGSQYTQLIARRIRELGVYCEIQTHTTSKEKIEEFAPLGIILSGGPETVTDASAPRPNSILYSLGKPILGICYGMQAIALQLGGHVETAKKREYGSAKITLEGYSDLFQNINKDKSVLPHQLDVWMSHGDRVVELPDGFQIIASSENAPMAGIADITRQLYGLQFHPEVAHTPEGIGIIRQFVVGICGCRQSWTPSHAISEMAAIIQATVGDDGVILGLSGGVDSAVTAALLNSAIGSQLTCIFVDNGLLRHGEADAVVDTFKKELGLQVVRLDASDQFLGDLEGITDPEEKRKIIGRVFIEIFQGAAKKQQGVKWLAQGTIYPDVIESGGLEGTGARVIKSHHNVGGLPDSMNLQLLEPLSKLFKDEVRSIGIELGLPAELVNRHPFPGPGLAVRVLGEVKQEFLEVLREVDLLFIEELRKADLYNQVSQAFAVFLPVKSVGVVGDNRSYEYVVALRAVETPDFMTARWARLPYEFLDQVSSRIINEVRGVSRVTYDISAKPPATIEWE